MPNNTYITNRTVERANNRQIERGIKTSSKESYCPNCKSFSVSIQYHGENISRTISVQKINDAFGKSLNTITDGKNL